MDLKYFNRKYINFLIGIWKWRRTRLCLNRYKKNNPNYKKNNPNYKNNLARSQRLACYLMGVPKIWQSQKSLECVIRFLLRSLYKKN
uniref:Uncharacterized protein n=1 Tax=Meloidogyne enterolobii TaxID=390850 RepID=A0A6V7Y2Y3_MELEN|nr:unnamed protein product [Meloidogyne enterolobii]